MGPQDSLSTYIEVSRKLLDSGQLDKYIRYAVFPKFKNLAPRSRIDFEFPLTAIIGPNGSGKSSILHAMYGMPYRSSTSRFWFSTSLDPISETGGDGPNRYFYSHYIHDIKEWVETKKVRGRKNESYWEPARASKNDGMQAMPKEKRQHLQYRSKDRWSATKRETVYISFKYQFSAFDKAFHLSNKKRSLAQRIDKIKTGAEKLSRVVEYEKTSYKPGGHDALFSHRKISDEEICWINFILGKNYRKARYIEHRLYDKEIGASIIFETGSGKYSEAFAGSGELAVVNLVVKIFNAEKNCLILLDEPETSLHPGAQKNIIKFILWSIVEKKTQVIISTHSTTIADALPEDALKTLQEGRDEKTEITTVTHKQEAFNKIGHVHADKKLFVVEDELLKTIVEVALDESEGWKKDIVELQIPPSGGDDIFKHLIPLLIQQGNDSYVFLDGDKKPEEYYDIEELESMNGLELLALVKRFSGCHPLYISSNDKERSIRYLSWVKERVFFLDNLCPEKVFLELLGVDSSQVTTNEKAKDELGEKLKEEKLIKSAGDIKVLFNFYLRNGQKKKEVEHIRECIRLAF